MNLAKYLQISPKEVYDLDYDFILRLETYIHEENMHNERQEARNKLKSKNPKRKK
ncbi:MAG TPA: hypothetical protein PKI46_07915 [Bacteroidales bacterium]|nr:hypothetical protein [Bacteroidales bacterium]